MDVKTTFLNGGLEEEVYMKQPKGFKVCTRLDITFVVGILGRYWSNPSINHWRVAKKVIKYLQGTKDFAIEENLDVIDYLDFDFVNYVDSRKSTLWYIFMMTLIATFVMEAKFVSCFKTISHVDMPPLRFKDSVDKMRLGSTL
ncbi:hypothetical protein CR513_35060, partial [Mucuna pruriens]